MKWKNKAISNYLSIQQPKQKISPKQAPQAIACTQEAKACPDGSYVSRTGPNCEFSICPK